MKSPKYDSYEPTSVQTLSGGYKYTQNNLDDHVKKDLNRSIHSESKFDGLVGQGMEIPIPSNILEFYTRLEVLLGLNLSGNTDILTEASILIEVLYKRGDIQNEQHY